MPNYDRLCPSCGKEYIDCLEPIVAPDPLCGVCGTPTERSWLTPTSMPNIIPDDIPGGIEIRHGLCNPDGSPRRYYSKSEMRDEARARGLINRVEHVPARGSDRSKHTVRWI